MQIRPIRTDADHTAAVKRIEMLMEAETGSREGDELDVLATLVVAYEKEHYLLGKPGPVAAIEFTMEQNGLTRRALEPLIGSRARVSEVLSGKRSLTLAMIRRLNASLNIPAEVLIGAPEATSWRGRRTPHEKKRLSLGKDRRNAGVENQKSSRKNIPL